MKRLITQLALLIAVLCVSVPAHAYDCIVDGICYDIDTSAKTAAVTYYSRIFSDNSGYYKGEKVIPEKITYNNNVYSVTSIGSYAFSGCTSLTTVTLGNSVTSIGENAFSSCASLMSVTLGNSVTSIGAHAFRSCVSLTSLEIPKSITTIGPWAFSYCTDLTTVTIGNSVTSIGSSAFEGCTGLTSVTCLAPNPPVCGEKVFVGIDNTNCTLYVLQESVQLYKAADQWKDFYKIEGLLGVDDITVDGEDAETLYDVYNMQGVKVGGGLRRADMTDALPRGIYILVSPQGTRKEKF